MTENKKDKRNDQADLLDVSLEICILLRAWGADNAPLIQKQIDALSDWLRRRDDRLTDDNLRRPA